MASGKKRRKKKSYSFALIAVLIIIIVIAAVAIWFIKPDLYHKFLGVGDHKWSEWDVVAATCAKDGEEKRECSVCGEKETKTLPKISSHKWGEWTTVAATCGKDGEEKRECSVCGEKETNTLPKTDNHTWGGWTTVAATCAKDGEEKRECSVCKATESIILPKLNDHTWGDWTTVDATCVKDGEKTRICSTCEEKESEVLPATGIHKFNEDDICTVCGYSESDSTGSESEIYSADLSIHFLELGNKYTGDSTLIKCGNTEILIDAGSRESSAATISAYIDKYCTDGILEYVIATHAHQDHIAGFVGTKDAQGILYKYSTGTNRIGTIIQFAGHNTTSAIYKNYVNAVEYAESNGTKVYTAKQCWYETDGAKKTYYLDDKQNISMNILYNYFYDNKASDENDYSVCMLLTEKAGETTRNYLFTGDLEEKGERYLVDNNALPEVELFKGGHHGSYTATTEKLLSVIKPKNVAVCCCCGTTEYSPSAGHEFPAQEFITRVSKYTENVYCTTLILDYKSKDNAFTSMNGNIVFYSKGGKLKLWCSNNTTKLKDTEWFKANRVWG